MADLKWFGDDLMLNGEDFVVNGARATVQEAHAYISGDTIAVRGWFGGQMVFYREVRNKQAERRAHAAARRAVEEAARKHLEGSS